MDKKPRNSRIVIDVKDVTVCDTVTSSKKLSTEHL